MGIGVKETIPTKGPFLSVQYHYATQHCLGFTTPNLTRTLLGSTLHYRYATLLYLTNTKLNIARTPENGTPPRLNITTSTSQHFTVSVPNDTELRQCGTLPDRHLTIGHGTKLCRHLAVPNMTDTEPN